MLVGFKTVHPGEPTKSIPQVAPSRYQLNSIKFTATIVAEIGQLRYDPTADTLAAISGGTDDIGKPMELFGVGFANGYERLGFGTNDGMSPEFEETSPLWSDVPQAELMEQSFNIYPLGDDGTGQLGNVFNSPGGEGIFQCTTCGFADVPTLVETTKQPWDTVPWAIGTVTGLAPGRWCRRISVVTFDVNLNVPGVREYFQESLSDGQVGVFLSSLHNASGFHGTGGGEAYAKYYTKENFAVTGGFADAVTLDDRLPDRGCLGRL